jgi:VIT1/CCC1 family predicted Fe2+/Mn2+ transporter
MDNEFQKEILERLIRIETKIDDYESTKTKVEEARSKAYSNERRINDIEDKLKWISRLTIGAIITGAITLIFAFFKLALKI